MVGIQHVVLSGALGLLTFLPPGAADSMSPRAPSEPRVLHFPADRSVGRLMIHPTAPRPLAVAHEWADYDEREEYFSQARGAVSVPAGYDVTLIVDQTHAWRDLSPLRQLRPDDLDRLNIQGSGYGGAKPRDLCMEHVAHLTGLRALDLQDTSVTNAGMKYVVALKGLRWLRPPPLMDDAGMAYVAQLPSLTHLYLGGNRLTNAGLAHLAKLNSLTELYLGGGRITDDGLAHLAKVPTLRYLMLEGKNFTDSGFRHLRNMPNLEVLQLARWAGVTDAGLAHLEQLAGLTRLKLFGGHHFSQPAIRHLFEALPELKYIQTGLVWPGERILREKVLAASYTTRPGVR
jgi:hypothetical protein